MQFNPPWSNNTPPVGTNSTISGSQAAGRHRRTLANVLKVSNPYEGGGSPYISPYPTSYASHVSRTFTQPHLAKYNMGMNGFPNPAAASASNGTMPSTPSSSQVRHFSGSSSATYQFPSPNSVYAWSGLGSESSMQTPLSTLQMSYENRPLVMSTNEMQMIPPGGYHTPPWVCADLSNCIANGSTQLPVNSSFGKHPKQTMAAAARSHLHSKRKVSHLSEQGPPPKVFVNEERMSACLRELNLDNNNLGWHPDLEQQPWYSGSGLNNNNDNENDRAGLPAPLWATGDEEEGEALDADVDSTPDFPRLEISDELKLSIQTKEILPKVILDEIAKPQLQVVLWKPSEDFIKDTLTANLPPRDSEIVTPDMCSTEGSRDTASQSVINSMETCLAESKPSVYQTSLRELSLSGADMPLPVSDQQDRGQTRMLEAMDDDCMDL